MKTSQRAKKKRMDVKRGEKGQQAQQKYKLTGIQDLNILSLESPNPCTFAITGDVGGPRLENIQTLPGKVGEAYRPSFSQKEEVDTPKTLEKKREA